MATASDFETDLVRLLELREHHYAEQRTLDDALRGLRQRLDACHRERSLSQLAGHAPAEREQRHCDDLEAEFDRVAMELAHVRLAARNVGEEIAAFGRERRLLRVDVD